MSAYLNVRTGIAAAIGVVVAVVADQLMPAPTQPSIADSLRWGAIVAVLVVLIARKAVRDRQRSEASWDLPT